VEKVCSAEEVADAVLLIVGRGARESVIEMDEVADARRVRLTDEVPVGVRLFWEVAEGVGEIVEVRVKGGVRLVLGDTCAGDALLALQRVGVGDVDCVFDAAAVRVIVGVVRMLTLLEADPVEVLEVVAVRVGVPVAVCVRVRGGLRVGEELVVDVLEDDTLAVEVGLPRIVRDCRTERVKEGLLEGVLEVGPLRVRVGVAEEVLEVAPLRVRVGVAVGVLEVAGELVPVLEVAMVLVAVAVEVLVRVEVWDAVKAGEAVVVFEIAPDFV